MRLGPAVRMRAPGSCSWPRPAVPRRPPRGLGTAVAVALGITSRSASPFAWFVAIFAPAAASVAADSCCLRLRFAVAWRSKMVTTTAPTATAARRSGRLQAGFREDRAWWDRTPTKEDTMKANKLAAVAATVAALGGISAVCATAGGPAAVPSAAAVDPSHFDSPQQNPYFPLRPGTVSRYRGSDDGERFHELVTVTHRTKRIQGVRTTVVRDVLRRADGTLAEKTRDWYAPDNRGNVWYFGE